VASQVHEDTYQAPYTEDVVEDDSEEDVIEDVYDMDTRGETTTESLASEIRGKILELYNLICICHVQIVQNGSTSFLYPCHTIDKDVQRRGRGPGVLEAFV
jgi:hypothetical protein